MNRLPDFLLIGAMKSGTTTLFDYLSSHPDIFMCRPKEPRFFSLDSNYSRGIEWYSQLFAAAGETQIVGEASTCYSRDTYYPDVVSRIAQHVPKAKLLYIMRDPAKRAYSHYRHRMEERLGDGEEVIPFADAIRNDPEIVETGLYARQIKRFLARFDSSRMHFIIFEELISNPSPQICELFEFLGIEGLPVGREPRRSNRSGSALALKRSDETLRRIRKSAPVRAIAEFVPTAIRKRGSSLVKAILPRLHSQKKAAEELDCKIPEFHTAEFEQMIDIYRLPNRELKQLLGRSIGHWSS